MRVTAQGLITVRKDSQSDSDLGETQSVESEPTTRMRPAFLARHKLASSSSTSLRIAEISLEIIVATSMLILTRIGSFAVGMSLSAMFILRMKAETAQNGDFRAFSLYQRVVTVQSSTRTTRVCR